MSHNVTEGEAIHSDRAAEVSRGRSTSEERRKARTVPRKGNKGKGKSLPYADWGGVERPERPLPSQTRTFSRLRWPLQNKNRCPLRGSHDNRSRTRPYSPSNPLRISVIPAAR